MTARINSEHLLTKVRDANVKLGGILWVERDDNDRWTVRKGNGGDVVETGLTTREACFFVSGMEFAAYLESVESDIRAFVHGDRQSDQDAGPADAGDAGQ